MCIAKWLKNLLGALSLPIMVQMNVKTNNKMENMKNARKLRKNRFSHIFIWRAVTKPFKSITSEWKVERRAEGEHENKNYKFIEKPMC